eukprot:6365443-Prymnesium_polylepis.1
MLKLHRTKNTTLYTVTPELHSSGPITGGASSAGCDIFARALTKLLALTARASVHPHPTCQRRPRTLAGESTYAYA